MKKFLISPPFGNWINHKSCERIRGSFTWECRNGLIYNTIKSFRPVEGGWINKIGLRNPGIRSIKHFDDDIYSLVGLEDGDWEKMYEYCPIGTYIEVNLGCPNVHEYGIPFNTLRDYCRKFTVIAKLPPTDIVDEMASMCIEAGVTYLHCSNTIPTEKGGISGLQLFFQNLPIVEKMSIKYPNKIIAGGGIYKDSAVRLYREAGATHFSLSTVWLTPWKIKDILTA